MLKKRSFTLIEVLISLTLLTFLLSALVFWHTHLTRQKGTLEKQKGILMEEHYAWQRLQQIIPTAQLPLIGDRSTLSFRFDRGISADPRLSATVLGKLYHDPDQKTLCLGIWPDPTDGREPSLTLTLLDQVESPTFHYYSPPNPFKKTVDPKEVGALSPEEGWQDEWIYDKLPAFVHLAFTHAGSKREHIFDLEQPILYPKRLSSSDSEEFKRRSWDFLAEANGQRPFARTKSTRDMGKFPEDEVRVKENG